MDKFIFTEDEWDLTDLCHWIQLIELYINNETAVICSISYQYIGLAPSYKPM